jgi:hypothetical protein
MFKYIVNQISINTGTPIMAVLMKNA